MLLRVAWPKDAIQPDELNMLQELLRQWCEEHGCDLKDSRASAVARDLISWFEFGIRDRAQLNEIIRPLEPFRGAPL
jgi:hypothetical protein